MTAEAMLDARLDFDSLVVGAGNRLAVAAARAVAESPGALYNPLFVYGDSGVGKTHVLGGIAKLVGVLHPQRTVAYASLVDFVDQYHAAIGAGGAAEWAARWQRVHVLLLDDVQFLTGQRETQAELMRLFATLQQDDRQIVVTSDRPPAEISDVDELLVSRLSGGLVVDISAPDYETRAAILRAAAQARTYRVPDDVLDELARHEFSNVRELYGALNRLVAHRLADPDAETPAAEVARALGLHAPGLGRRRSVSDFLNYLAGGSSTPTRPTIESWKAQVHDAIAHWRAEGVRTAQLERLLATPGDGAGVDGTLAAFAAAAAQLRGLERRAAALDPALAANEVFRDPARVADAEALVAQAVAGSLPPPGPQGAYARGALEVSTSNALAVRAADAVVAEPGRFNPLFIFGPPGVGKTHLLHAIGNQLRARGAVTQIACLPAARFVDELIAAIGANAVERWRARYRGVGALLLDDVQHLAGKQRSQEELFHVFNALHTNGRQLVFVADRAPRSIPHIEERLRTRFEGGLVVPIEPPDRALRERLVARTLEQRGRRADAELVETIAASPAAGVRDLLSAVHRIVSDADARQATLTADYVRASGTAVRESRATPARPSLAVADKVFADPEKVIWEWPDAAARLIEEYR